jgi:alpha-ketoglutarate-dependent taurine dioxygenase
MTSSLQFLPISLPESIAKERLSYFGREVVGFDVHNYSSDDFKQVEEALYKHDMILLRNLDLTPEAQLKLVKAFDPSASIYGLGHTPQSNKSFLAHYIKQSVPNFPQIQVIGHGTVRNHEGIEEITLKHGRHPEFHKTPLSEEEESNNFTRFFRWHVDSALYELDAPKVTSLYAIKVPSGPLQTVRYDDGSGDELKVTLGTTAMVSGKVMFDILPNELKSFAVRSRVRYPPHPFDWLSYAKALSNGLTIVTESKETPLDKLAPWDESKIKIYPLVWKNPVTGNLHLQVPAIMALELEVDPLPENSPNWDVALYPNGGKITDLKETRDLLYKLQRPGISPHLVYPHPWQEKDLMIFHNRGVMHSVVGVFKEDQVRLFHQCNLASPTAPVGPTEDDIKKWA